MYTVFSTVGVSDVKCSRFSCFVWFDQFEFMAFYMAFNLWTDPYLIVSLKVVIL
jgi:hypothetical protein